MQTGREAIDSLIHKRRADFVPHTDGPWSDTLRKWVTQGMPTDGKGGPADPAGHFAYDMAGCGGWFDWHPRRGFSETVEETDEWRITRNGSGAVLKYWKSKSGTPEHIDFHMTDLYKQCYGILFAEAGLPDGVWIYEDLGYKERLFCSPRVLEEVIFPYFKEIVDFFHGHGLPVILHSCGYQEAALPLIVQAGFDGLHPMEVKAGNDIFKFAEQYGDRLLFVGGLDERILESRDRAVIRRGVTAFMDGMKARGARFVYGSDHSLSTNIDYADYLYSLEVYREQRAR